MLDDLKNDSDKGVLEFGVLKLPEKFNTEYEAVRTIIGIMALLGILTNATLLLVIIRDPNKQLRTNTAILVGFQGLTNFLISLCSGLDRILAWSGRPDIFTPKLTMYLGVCNVNMYFLGSLLLALNSYSAIVAPLFYKKHAPKQPRKIMVFVGLVSLANACVFLIIPCALSSSKTDSYIKVIFTLDLVIFTVLTLVFIVLYVGIFRALYARKRRLHSFHVTSSRQGLLVVKQNDRVATTLFIHITYLVFASVPGNIAFLLVLHCRSCNSTKVQLLALFIIPLSCSLLLLHPLLWLCRMKNYRQALKKIFRCRNNARRQVLISQPSVTTTSTL